MTRDHDQHDAMESAVAAYVLDACDEDERERVRAHVEGCPSCTELARRLHRSVTVIPLASQVVPPPARLRQRILAAAAAAPPGTVRLEVAPPARVIHLPKPPAEPRRWR